jgi:hypothetical protein
MTHATWEIRDGKFGTEIWKAGTVTYFLGREKGSGVISGRRPAFVEIVEAAHVTDWVGATSTPARCGARPRGWFMIKMRR